jgi:hypothetical protein
VFRYITNWFKTSLLSLNFDATSLVQFLTKNTKHITIRAGCDNNIKSNITNVKFFINNDLIHCFIEV